jgi:hypothetical protein
MLTGISLHVQWPLTSQSHGSSWKNIYILSMGIFPYERQVILSNQLVFTVADYLLLILLLLSLLTSEAKSDKLLYSTRVRIQKPVVTGYLVSYYRKAVCQNWNFKYFKIVVSLDLHILLNKSRNQ